ncbi:unnamed protein product [Toxocara canis]|uniref:RNase III domain-containing protein n=1 Tax=Toxocara canis TaxID=6265 RepID=A0A183U7X4_TOXCA|nr:unnamed protein product [Toxocara canis]
MDDKCSAHDACHKAYKLEPKDADVLKWCSIITGSLADISCNKEKIELGHEFKVANLSWLERTAATALFGAPPTATIDEALADLLKVLLLPVNQTTH